MWKKQKGSLKTGSLFHFLELSTFAFFRSSGLCILSSHLMLLLLIFFISYDNNYFFWNVTSFFSCHPPSFMLPYCPLRLNPHHYQWQLKYWKTYITLRGRLDEYLFCSVWTDPQAWCEMRAQACGSTLLLILPGIISTPVQTLNWPPSLCLLGAAATLC